MAYGPGDGTNDAMELQPATDWAPMSQAHLSHAQDVLRQTVHALGTRKADGTGNCLAIAFATKTRLIGDGFPPEAMGTRVVQYDPGRGQAPQQHALLDLQYIDGQGKKQVYTLDMNSPWNLRPSEEAAEYKPVPQAQNPYTQFTQPQPNALAPMAQNAGGSVPRT